MLIAPDSKQTSILARILSKLNIKFAILDAQFIIIESNYWDMSKEVPLLLKPGHHLFDIFPKLSLSPKHLESLSKNLSVNLTIPKFAWQLPDQTSVYIRLHLESIEANQYLLICEDVTEEGELEDDLQRSYNQIHMLHTKLDHTTARLGRLLERFMPAKVAQKILQDEEIPFPGGQDLRECTVLFTDMRNFTAFAEQVSSDRALSVLNTYFGVMNQVIETHEGSIVQLIGDLLMAIFNVPDDQPDHVRRACLAACAIRDSLQKLNQEAAQDFPRLRFGIGISTGLVTPGYLGSKNRYQFAAVGDVTNVAYHLCSQASADQIIIAQTSLDVLKRDGTFVHTNPLGNFQLKRRKKPLPAYELLGLE